MGQEPSNTPPPARAAHLRRALVRTAVFLFVAWHLLFFAVRNPLDLWSEPITEWLKEHGWWERYGDAVRRVDRLTDRYAKGVGCEQGWVMFRPPMARAASFLAVRFEFTDDSRDTTSSENEPDPRRFFRLGGWQTRKLEDQLLDPPDDLAKAPSLPAWEGYARYALRRWKERHPDDPRQVRRIVLVRRRIAFPWPGQPPGAYEPATEKDIAAFGPDGRLCR
jgi:hypothetical protein